MPALEGKDLLARAGLYEPLDADVRVPVFTAGVGHTESFDKDVLLASPHTEHRIWAGRLDRAVGHGGGVGASSLRLDGPTEAWTPLGPSYFVTPFAKRNRVTAWVRTENASGEGPAIGLRRLQDNTAEFHATGLTGTRDWTPVSYVTEFPGDSFGVLLFVRNSGGGTVWFDDLRIEPLADDAPANASRARPLAPGAAVADPNLVLRWAGDGDASCLLDASGHGHHGKLYGTAAWGDDGGQRTLALDGRSTYLWPLTSPRLNLGPDSTVVMDVKPETAGCLGDWGFKFQIRMEGAGPEFALAYQPSGGASVQSRPFLKAGSWQRLAIVTTPDAVLVYRDGELMERLAVKPVAGDWSLHHQTTWHRRLSFFGHGPGDMGLVAEASGGHWKGQVRSVSVWNGALPADRLRTP